MKATLWQDSYGKSRVRLTKVNREGKVHDAVEISVDIELSGDFEAAYIGGDNSLVIPTDTMKNTVYALARQHDVRFIEPFAELLARHFLDAFAQVDFARVDIEENSWQRVDVDGKPHPHTFVGSNTERNRCAATATRGEGEHVECGVSSGLKGLLLMKTAQSGFAGFVRDPYTTLAETEDRILATTVEAEWLYDTPPADFRIARETVRSKLIDAFAAKYSPSVQATLNEMANAVLALSSDPNVGSIRLELPNQHRLLVNLEPFGLDNPNTIFVPMDEPYGKISAEYIRGSVSEEPEP